MSSGVSVYDVATNVDDLVLLSHASRSTIGHS